MAKTKGPLLSLDAHGTLGDLLTYSHKQSGRQVRLYNKPLKPPSAKQRGRRRITEFLVAQWQGMSAGDKAVWEAYARVSGLNLEGYHYFLREAQRDLYTHHGMVAYYPLNRIVSGKAIDYSNNGLDGTLSGVSPVLTDSQKTHLGNAYDFHPGNGYVDCGKPAEMDLPTVLSIEFLVNPYIVSQNYQAIISNYDSATKNCQYDASLELNNLQYTIADAYTYQIFKLTDVFAVNKWHWITITDADNKDVFFYVNGVKHTPAKPGTATKPTTGFGNTSLARPGDYNGLYIDAILDEVCLYNRVLTETEVKARYKFATRKI